jgi:hypothetical protein
MTVRLNRSLWFVAIYSLSLVAFALTTYLIRKVFQLAF